MTTEVARTRKINWQGRIKLAIASCAATLGAHHWLDAQVFFEGDTIHWGNIGKAAVLLAPVIWSAMTTPVKKQTPPPVEETK